MPILRILKKIFEYFYRRNIKKLEAQTELVNNLSLRIDEIKKYEKYLTNSDKEELEETLLRQIKNIFFIKLKKYKKVLSSDYINKYENIRSFKKNIYEFFENYNQVFIKKESERYKSFFENIDSNPLTESQIKALEEFLLSNRQFSDYRSDQINARENERLRVLEIAQEELSDLLDFCLGYIKLIFLQANTSEEYI